MKKVLSIFLILYMFLFNISTCFAETTTTNDLNLEAETAILIDAKTGTVLYEKEADKKEYPASITKLMTVLLVMEYGKFDETITFSEEAIFGIERNSSHIALDVGEQITIEEALYAMLLVSANEACLGVAEHIAGSIEEFSKRMTEKAKELGCTNTNFVNPNGLHNENHYTTARDMALITKELLKYDKFREIASTTYYELKPTNLQSETRYLYADHKMIRKNNTFYYEGCEGGKTGFTNEALNTLVTFAKRGDTELIAVTLKDTGSNTYKDTAKLFDYGFNNFKTMKVFSADKFSKEVPVVQTYKDMTKNLGNITASGNEDVYVTVPYNTTEQMISTTVSLPDNMTAPVKYDDEVGMAIISLDSNTVAEIPLYAKTSVLSASEEELKAEYYGPLKDTIKKIAITIVTILIIVFIIFVIIVRIRNERRRRLRRLKFRQKYRSNYYR